MAVGAKDHVAAAGEGLAGILVDNCLVCRHIDTSVLLSGGKTEDVVILIDGTAYSAERVVTVGHCVRERELVQSAGACCLDDTYVGNVVGNHGIEADAHFLALAAVHVVSAEDAVGNGVFTGLVGGEVCLFGYVLAVKKVNTVGNQFYHNFLF